MTEQQNQQQQVQIRAADQDLKGVYSNVMQVQHTQEEFILDFLGFTPQAAILVSRVIVSPGHLKRMIAALQDNLGKYEGSFGSVSPAEEPTKMGFKLGEK